MEIVQKITLDLSDVAVYRTQISAKQNDDARKIHATITDHGQPYTIPSGTTAQIRCGKPDGHIAVGTASVSGNTVTVTLTEQMLAAPGRVLADICLKNGGKDLSTASFVIIVERIPGGAALASSNEFLELTLAHRESKEAAAAAASSAAASEASAVRSEAAAQAAETMIDDTVIAAEKTHSSEHIYDLACATITETAPVVACHPVEGYPIKAVTHIVPKQDGNGDPSPTNVRKLAHKNPNLIRCGKNLIDFEPKPLSALFDGNIFVKGQIKPVAYKLTLYDENGSTDGLKPVASYIAEFTDINSKTVVSGIATGATPTAEECERIVYLHIFYNGKYSGTGTQVFAQLELGSTATPYEPYTGQIYTATLPPDAFGGEVDWDKKEFKSNLFYRAELPAEYFNSQGTYYELVLSATPVSLGSVSAAMTTQWFSLAKVGTATGAPGEGYLAWAYQLRPGKNFLRISKALHDKMVATGMTLEAAIQVVEPNKPESITVSGITTALPGINTVYSDTSDVTVIAPEDPNYTTKKLVDRIAALEAAALN